MPRLLAHDQRRLAPRRIERLDRATRSEEALLVERPVGGQVGLAMAVEELAAVEIRGRVVETVRTALDVAERHVDVFGEREDLGQERVPGSSATPSRRSPSA